jgi:hypothetical protein
LPSEYVYFIGVVFTPDSRHIVSNIYSSNNQGDPYTGIWLMDTLTGRPVRKLPAKKPSQIALSSDGLWLTLLGFPSPDTHITVWKRVE